MEAIVSHGHLHCLVGDLGELPRFLAKFLDDYPAHPVADDASTVLTLDLYYQDVRLAAMFDDNLPLFCSSSEAFCSRGFF